MGKHGVRQGRDSARGFFPFHVKSGCTYVAHFCSHRNITASSSSLFVFASHCVPGYKCYKNVYAYGIGCPCAVLREYGWCSGYGVPLHYERNFASSRPWEAIQPHLDRRPVE